MGTPVRYGVEAQSLSAQARMRWWAIAALRRHEDAEGLVAGEHGADLVAGKPAAVLQLGDVGADVLVERLAEAADHQRIGERPGLAGVIDDAAEPDAGFLQRLAPHRVLDRLARLDEAGERRIHAGHEMRAAAEQAALARHRQHDRHRVGARKMLGARSWGRGACSRRPAFRCGCRICRRSGGWRARRAGPRLAPARPALPGRAGPAC